MDIFRDYTFPWYDAGILKWTTLFLGIFIGAKWPQAFEGWSTVLLILAIIGMVYLVVKYWPSMFKKKVGAQTIAEQEEHDN